MDTDGLATHAQELLDANRYLTLGTVDADGQPWTTPVYFAADGLRTYYWVSSEVSRHSVNVVAHPTISLAVFDSTVPAYHGRCLYAAATVDLPTGDDLDHALEIYPGPPERGGAAISLDDVTGSSPWRLYRARASDVWVLCPREPRAKCPLHGRDDDHRVRIG